MQTTGLFDMGGCQKEGPFLDPYSNTAPNIQGTQKETIFLTTTHMLCQFGVFMLPRFEIHAGLILELLSPPNPPTMGGGRKIKMGVLKKAV